MAEMFRTLMLEHIHFANLFASKFFQTLQFVILLCRLCKGFPLNTRVKQVIQIKCGQWKRMKLTQNYRFINLF